MLMRVLRTVLRARRHPSVSLKRALKLYQEDRLDEAERACREAYDAMQADVNFMLGLIAQKRSDHVEAVRLFAAAAAERDGEGSFHYSLGEARFSLGHYEKALASLQRFVALAATADARLPNAFLLCAKSCAELGRLRESEEWCRRSESGAAQNETILHELIHFHLNESRVREARRLAQPSPSMTLAHRIRYALMLPAIYASREEIPNVRMELQSALESLAEASVQPTRFPELDIGITPFYLAYHATPNVDLLRRICAVARLAYPGGDAVSRKRHADARIRVGFISTFFYNHSVGRTTIGLIRDLPRDRFHVTVFSMAARDDPVRATIAAAADEYVTLTEYVEASRKVVADAGLDVLVFADIGMHPATYFLSFWRLAPVQITTWGHSETSGIDTIDYYLSAQGVELPSAQEHYSEQLLRPDAFFLPGYARLQPFALCDRAMLGLPTDRRLYACLQAPFKLHPDMDAVFGRILDLDPEGEILLISGREAWSEQLRMRFSRTIGPNANRVRFLPMMNHVQYLNTLRASDVALDPLYFGGCNSSCEAMSLGVPVVTLPGQHLHGRFTLGLYGELGLRDCIASEVEGYVNLAMDIARDSGRRADLGREIAVRSEVLFERKDFTLATADVLEEIVAQKKAPPRRGFHAATGLR